jgi:hypothetical protein
MDKQGMNAKTVEDRLTRLEGVVRYVAGLNADDDFEIERLREASERQANQLDKLKEPPDWLKDLQKQLSELRQSIEQLERRIETLAYRLDPEPSESVVKAGERRVEEYRGFAPADFAREVPRELPAVLEEIARRLDSTREQDRRVLVSILEHVGDPALTAELVTFAGTKAKKR